MRAVLVLLAAVAASAQTGEDARPLLESISSAVRSAGSVRAEGVSVRETTGGRGTTRQETSFELVTQGPLLMRYHATNGPNRTLQICDGTSRWTYLELPNTYARSTAEEQLCSPPLAPWRNLAEYLVSAKVTGQDHSEFEGRSQACEVIEAAYETPKPFSSAVPMAGRVALSFCVDPVRRLILRERIQTPEAASSTGSTHYSLTVTYSRIEYNPPQDAEIFQFQPPAGSTERAVNVPLTGEGGGRGYAGAAGPGGGFTAPILTSKHEPQYSPEALKAKLQGSVLVKLVVDETGVPRNIQVVRGLGMGLDEKAVEAVGAWRWNPGTRGGQPIAVPAQVEVNFRLARR